jgi:hypothetical protein
MIDLLCFYADFVSPEVMAFAFIASSLSAQGLRSIGYLMGLANYLHTTL